MTTRVKYTANRNYRDFLEEETPIYDTKKNRKNTLTRKKITFWDKVKDIFRK